MNEPIILDDPITDGPMTDEQLRLAKEWFEKAFNERTDIATFIIYPPYRMRAP
jgi:hypothetical protein